MGLPLGAVAAVDRVEGSAEVMVAVVDDAVGNEDEIVELG